MSEGASGAGGGGEISDPSTADARAKLRAEHAHAHPHASSDVRADARADVRVAFRNAVKLGTSLLGTSLVALVVRFQLPRQLGPAAFGQFNFTDGFVASLFVFAGLGLDTYIQKEVSARPGHANDFALGALLVRLTAFALLAAVLVVVFVATGRGELVWAGLVFAAAQACIVTNTSIAALFQASTRVSALAITNVAVKIVWGAGTLVALRFTKSLTLLALPLFFAEAAKATVLAWVALRHLGLRLAWNPMATRATLAAALPYFVNTVAYSLGSKLDVAVLEFVAPPEEVGFYGAASTLSMLALLLSPLVSWVLMPLLTRARRRSEDEFFVILRRGLEAVLLAAAPISVVLAVGADVFIRWAFGSAYAQSAPALAVLAPSFLLTYAAVFLATALIIMDRSWSVTSVNLATTFCQPALIVVLVSWARRHFSAGGAGAMNAAILTTLEAISVTSFLVLIGRRAIDKRLLRSVVKTAVVAALVFAVDRAWRGLGDARVFADAAAYVAFAFALRVVQPQDLALVLRLVRERRGGAGA